jgi:hypothetical protein
VHTQLITTHSVLLQFWGAGEKETQQQRLETAIFEDLNRYCWNQQSSTANISISTATSNSSGSGSTTSGPQIINSTDGQVLIYNNRRRVTLTLTSLIEVNRLCVFTRLLLSLSSLPSCSRHKTSNFEKIYTITVLNSSSADQWLRKDITTSGGGGGTGTGNGSSGGEQPNGLDINLDTILNNYPYVKTECFSYEDSGFSKDDIDIAAFQPHATAAAQILQPQSNVTTTSILLESTLSASSDLINYTDVSNNNADWSMEQSEIKDWEANEAISNVSVVPARESGIRDNYLSPQRSLALSLPRFIIMPSL